MFLFYFPDIYSLVIFNGELFQTSDFIFGALLRRGQVVRALLGAGAGDGKRINRKTNPGNTSLHFACSGQ
jgi:hypothetical protein